MYIYYSGIVYKYYPETREVITLTVEL